VETSSGAIVVPAKAMTWSSALWASRMLPSAARATSISASSLTASPSASAIFRSCSAIALTAMARNSNTCARERIVSGIFASSVVARTNATCGGGSSMDFRRALNEWLESW